MGAERAWLASLLGCALAFGLFAALAPLVASPSSLALGAAVVLAFACVSGEVLIAARLAPALAPKALFGLAIPVAALACVAIAGDAAPKLLAGAIVTAMLLGAGTSIGAMVGSRIDRAGHLVVVAVVSGLVDAFSVLHPSGPTAQLVQIETALSVLVLPWPIVGTDRIEPILGLGDVVFAALYVAAARKHGLSLRRTVIALALGLGATLIAVLVSGIGLPALPFLGVSIVAAHPEARRIPREDRVKAAVGIGALIALFAALFALRT